MRLSLCILALLVGQNYINSQTCSAIPVVTLNPGGVGPIGAHLMVTYNPLKNIYYWSAGGFPSNPAATHSATGGSTLSFGTGSQDWRGFWWNSNTNTLEGNCFSSAGIYTLATDPVTGYIMNGSSIVSTNQQPTAQSGGQYDAATDQVIYHNALSIYKYSRSTGNLSSIVSITGLPGGFGSISPFGFFTGIAGMEYAIYDFTNRRAYYVNYITGAYVSTIQFPPSAGAPSNFGLSFANGLFFIYDNTNWIGYRAGIWASTTAPICLGQNATLTAQGSNSYSWNTGSTTSSISVSPPSTTIYTVTGTGTAGCISTFTLSVPVIPFSPPTLSVGGNTIVCGGANTTLTANGALTYTWNLGQTTSSIVVAPMINTTYSVTGTSSVGCSVMQTITVNSFSNPTVSVAGNTNICEGQTTTLTLSGANSYSWNNGSTSSSEVLSPTVTTNYTVTGTDPSTCSNTKTLNIVVNANPTVGISSSTSVCSGQSIALGGTGANTYSWNTGATSTSISVSPTVNTTYSVIGNTIPGCSGSASKTITVLISPTVVANSNTNSICQGNTVSLTSSGADTYSWSTGAQTFSTIDSPNNNITYTVTGTSTVNNCFQNAAISVTVFPAPQLTITSPNMICFGQSAVLSVTGAVNYTWSTGSNSTSITDSPTVNTTYSVSGTSSLGCSATKSVTVIVSICNSVVQNTNFPSHTYISPNPASDQLNVNTELECLYEIFDQAGRTVMSGKLSEGNTRLFVGELANGIYSLQLKNANGSYYSKLVVCN
jgi:hypothetical protein